jgi:hypothetical protein
MYQPYTKITNVSTANVPGYGARFKQWRFYALLLFVGVDFLTPFFPFSAAILLGMLFVPKVQTWVARLLFRALTGRKVV